MRIGNHTFPTYGIDLGKMSFQFIATDKDGKPSFRIKLRHDALIAFFANATPALIGMESCPGAHWLARKLQKLGPTVRLITPQFVKPYVKSNKNDTLDAEAIAEAVTRPTMRFVPIKRDDQIAVQALHRVCEHVIEQRTAIINQCRCFLLEYGIAIRVRAGVFKHDLPYMLADDANELTPAMRQVLNDLWTDFLQLEHRITALSRQIESQVNQDESAQRLMSISGTGPLGASALCAAIGDGKQFRKGRDLAAWIGLVSRQYSTGGKTTLLGISKRGNAYLRRLLVLGGTDVPDTSGQDQRPTRSGALSPYKLFRNGTCRSHHGLGAKSARLARGRIH